MRAIYNMDGTPDDNFPLSSVYSQSYFVIPDYQRDYAWSESNVNDLLDDIEFLYERNETGDNNQNLQHYFGTIVLEHRGSVEPTDFQNYDVYGIVDGQQRLSTVAIVISAIVDEMSKLASNDNASGNLSSQARKRKDTIAEKYIQYENIERIRLGGLAEDAYNDIILDSTQVDDYLQNNELVEAERKIAGARQATNARLTQWKKSKFVTDSLDIPEYYRFLNTIVKILTQEFEVNIKVVENVDEAARMFKVINNRGRDLRLHDKVRSHLVYCASQSSKMDSERIYRKFNNIVKNVTIHDGFSDSEVDDLVRIHWKVFTSERSDSRSKRTGPNQIHRRLSDLKSYASIQRQDYETFIEPYINSLEEFSQVYPYMTNRQKFAEEYYQTKDSGEQGIRMSSKKIQLLYMHPGVQSATAPLLIAVSEKFGVSSPEFTQVVSELEKLVFGFSLVMSHGVQGYRNILASVANDLYWSNADDSTVEDIFNSTNDRYKGYKSKELGIKKCLERLREKRERITDINEVVSDYLTEPDVLEGNFTSGWGGIRSNEVIKYIMYEYEEHLRDTSGVLSLAPYHEFRKEFDVEHLVPKNAKAEDKLRNHKQNRNRIGNLAVLSVEQNQSKGNSAYERKYEDIYSNSSLKILRNLTGPEVSVSDIHRREEEKIIPFIMSRWG
jgi:hypothetical protein